MPKKPGILLKIGKLISTSNIYSSILSYMPKVLPRPWIWDKNWLFSKKIWKFTPFLYPPWKELSKLATTPLKTTLWENLSDLSFFLLFLKFIQKCVIFLTDRPSRTRNLWNSSIFLWWTKFGKWKISRIWNLSSKLCQDLNLKILIIRKNV